MTAETIKVDAERLQQIGASLDIVANALDAGNDALIDKSALHSALISDALGDFTKAWSDKRARLIEDIRSAAAMVRTAAEQFSTVDRSLTEQLGSVASVGAAAAAGAAKGGVATAKPTSGSSAATTTPVVAPPAPAGYSPGPVSDRGWTARGFAPRNCTDYTAWALDQMLRANGSPHGFVNDMRQRSDGSLGPPGKWGNGVEWLKRADQLGYPHDDTPRVGAVAYWPGPNKEGHVAIVREVRPDGSVVVDSYDGLNETPTFGVVHKPGTSRYPTEFLHIVKGT